MPYDDPTLKEFDNYYQARSASQRERAENWAVAIGLQKVDGLVPSEKAQLDANRQSGQKKAVRKKRSEKSGQKTADRLVSLLKANPHLTQEGMVAALMITRSTVQKHISNLKKAGRLRRVGPDKGGHWEVIG